jgi:hypothetical protein
MTAVPVTPHETSVHDAMRPFALLAVVAFLAGFVGYVLLGQGAAAQPPSDSQTVVADPAAAGPASDDWNLPKHI